MRNISFLRTAAIRLIVATIATVFAIGTPTYAHAQSATPKTVTPKIVNGTVASPTDAPWMAAIQIGSSGLCGGTLVDPSWVLTAAHCVWDFSNPSGPILRSPAMFTVYLGSQTLSAMTSSHAHAVTRVIPHPSWEGFHSDIALLQLTTPVNTITPLALNTDMNFPYQPTPLRVYGWGRTSTGGAVSDSLLYGNVGNPPSCGRWGGSDPIRSSEVICAQGLTPTSGVIDACSGDSGGPLVATVNRNGVATPTLVGTVSFGTSSGCALLGTPTVYMRVSASIRWLAWYLPRYRQLDGYRLVASDGGIFTFGDAAFKGSTGNITLNQPIVGMARTASGNGYWLVASDGGIFTFGDAAFKGSTGNIKLNQPIVSMAATPSGNGYWLVASDGGIFTFGDAKFKGSTGNIKLNQPIVGMAATPTGNGYWLLANDGGIFAFGDAEFKGSAANLRRTDFAAILPTKTGLGYLLISGAGGVHAYGDARSLGSITTPLNAPIVGAALSPTGNGYWLLGADGGIFSFGDAMFKGSTGNLRLNRPVLGMSSVG